MNQLAPIQPNQLPMGIQQLMSQMTQSELSAGVGPKFAVISVRGKVFRIKHEGNEQPIMIVHQGQQYPAPFLDVVLVKANAVMSKTYYKDGFTETSDSPPDCWSEDGINPLSPMNQRPLVLGPDGVTGVPCTDCRTCPMNAFGSRVNTATGKGGKACADTRKVAITPAEDPANLRYGGGMLFRVPAASLGALAEYDRKLQAAGVPYFAVVTRVTFDQTVAYPKLCFDVVRMITDAEAAEVVQMRQDPRTDLVLQSGQASAPPAPAALPALANQAVPAAFSAAPGAAPLPPPDAHLYPPTPAPAPAPPQQVFATPAPAPTPVYANPAPAPAYAPPAVAPATFGGAAPAPATFGAPAPAPAPAYAPPPATFGAPPPAPAPGGTFGAPPPAAAAPAYPTMATVPAPVSAGGPVIDANFFQSIDRLIGS